MKANIQQYFDKENKESEDFKYLTYTKIDELINKARLMVELFKEHKQNLINNVVTINIKVIQ
ncbi:MAG: hypothetical protein PHC75_05160 [Burkholderiales bacterium]|nr:hypothetical protein [Burkholderiales bacterium]